MIIGKVKTPRIVILGVFLCLIFSIPKAFATCGRGEGSFVSVSRIVDGDTLQLADGRKVRLIGVNAPEVRHRNKPGEPLGDEASRAVNAFIYQARGRVQLGYEVDREDHYGRLLAHVYNPQGQSLGEVLAAQGFAFVVAVPPNVAQISCLGLAQEKAYQQGLGIWIHPGWQPISSFALAKDDVGFKRVKGRVAGVTIKRSVWIELEGNLVISIPPKNRRYFNKTAKKWRELVGKTLEVDGWIFAQQSHKYSSKPLMMSVRSPVSLRLISPGQNP